ncbi:DUF2190 family protein [Candidatus Persebacteraceae bacterium Df01]|jgi:hypothetical protein|uniref:DUF2190 family protein n=1 Tax=Candidatus Doriopsillibacter californiensis TaxID=2970740 RepID=A0ABT7QMJ8_9GAMM|nr:DUF2190 family protein [Candidatus Persebacteraceae bacterium Df01]
MSNQILTTSLEAAADLPGCCIVRPTADGIVNLATAGSHLSIGITDKRGGNSGEQVGVIVSGIAEVEASATIVRGAAITAAADGKGATAASGNRAIGVALESASAGETVRVLIGIHTA